MRSHEPAVHRYHLASRARVQPAQYVLHPPLQPTTGSSNRLRMADAPFLLPGEKACHRPRVMIDGFPRLLPIVHVEQKPRLVSAGAHGGQPPLHESGVCARLDDVHNIGTRAGQVRVVVGGWSRYGAALNRYVDYVYAVICPGSAGIFAACPRAGSRLWRASRGRRAVSPGAACVPTRSSFVPGQKALQSTRAVTADSSPAAP